MKKQISFDDQLHIICIYTGNYLRDDGNHEEYIERNYAFELFTSGNMDFFKKDDITDHEINVKWIDKEPFRNTTEKETIEKKIIKKFINR